ncbi:hypothetical protein UB31_28495 [Bradyrhizobium sp. LTSP849]|uniref:hypothetical protein n=1 Tax=Bradyrhizobium sp. LTSP849 TaxID=1615890 RepID=UPI0005D1B241|nr:hypothetical protein [Bradyrhizobium sp. LTSP849]KJC40220.1 hypothetical protein UB31_28495 [Bradyrhizobium sp. LTSP849]
MGTVVKLLKRSTKPAYASAGSIQVDAVRTHPQATTDQIVAVASACEILIRSINVLQRNLKTLDAILHMIDDPETRVEIEQQLKSIDASLLSEFTKLSGIKCMMKRLD